MVSCGVCRQPSSRRAVSLLGQSCCCNGRLISAPQTWLRTGGDPLMVFSWLEFLIQGFDSPVIPPANLYFGKFD